MIDSEKAVLNFLRQADRFGQLVLVTDSEVEELYGEEVAAALARLEWIGQEEHLCSDCAGLCCYEIGCELYDVNFNRCPVYDMRPLLCRVHFCDRFYIRWVELFQPVRNVFLSSLRALGDRDSDKAKALSIPPLAGGFPELAAAFSLVVGEMREGKLDPELAAELIRREAENYRTAGGSRRI
ncbi:hypothetical protein ACFLW2_03055 [Chloroflexota bacterium]